MLHSIDRYELRREIGRGATSTVYFAYDPRIGREVAVKLMLTPGITNLASRKRFEQEARAIATLEHPTIVPLYDFGECEGKPYIVMRYMAGGSLTDQLRQGPIPFTDALVVVSRVASALDQAHRRGIVHRDIKPDNILFDQYGNGFLSDFGIVQMPSHHGVSPSQSGATGTPAYMSPEQILRTGKLDGRSDVYSLGAVLYEMLSGAWPYSAESPYALAVKHVSEPPPSLLAVRPELPSELDRIISQAMSKRPQNRYPTAGAMVRDLLETTGHDIKALVDRDMSAFGPHSGSSDGVITGVITDGDPPTRNLSVRPPRTRRWALWAAGLAVLGTMIALIFVSTRPGSAIFTDQTPAATPIGGGAGRIAFESQIGGVPDIYFMNTDGSDVRRIITDVNHNRGADWSPDGQVILFRSHESGNRVIYIMHPDGSGLTPLTESDSSNYAPTWSPDGSRIAFVSERDGNPEIYVMNADGSDQTRLTNDLSPDYEPAWSPDGTQIAFHTGRDGNLNIYRMNSDGSHLVRLTDSSAADYGAVWSPDGSRIAFVSEDDGDAEIYVMDPDGTDKVRLTDNSSADFAPAWSPDGTWIAFVARRDGNAEIYLMRANGSNQRRLTNTRVEDLDPVWQP